MYRPYACVEINVTTRASGFPLRITLGVNISQPRKRGVYNCHVYSICGRYDDLKFSARLKRYARVNQISKKWIE